VRRDGGTVTRRDARKRIAACAGAAVILQLDGTITVALPSVAHDLDVSAASTSLVLSTYIAAYALMLVPAAYSSIDSAAGALRAAASAYSQRERWLEP